MFGVVLVALLVFAAVFDWNWMRGRCRPLRLRHPAAAGGDRRNLRVKLFSWTPTGSVEGLRIGQPKWAPQGDMARIDKITASIRLPSLLTGRLVMPLLAVEQPKVALFRDDQGRANWDFGREADRRQAAETAADPDLHHQRRPRHRPRRPAGPGVRRQDQRRASAARAAYAEGFTLVGEGS